MLEMLTSKIIANSTDQFISRKLALRLHNSPLAMHPIRLNRIEPRAFDWQTHYYNSGTSLWLCFAIVSLYPATHFLRLVPSGVVPNKHQYLLAFLSQALIDPLEEIYRYLADWTTINETQQKPVYVTPKQPITAKRFRVWIIRH